MQSTSTGNAKDNDTVTSKQEGSSSVRRAPYHLNSTGCHIRYIEGKGRGVFASRQLPRNELIEVSPVLLFTPEEYEAHGKYTVLDHYTFKWRDGRMALALGLGSLFNHSRTPNVSYTLDPDTESIRYTTTRVIEEGEELCIFYGHKLWFEPTDIEDATREDDEPDDGWGGLSLVGNEEAEDEDPLAFLLDGDDEEIIPEDQLPFVRMKLIDDEAEDEPSAVITEPAWVVDISEPRHTNTLLKWLKQSGLDTPSLAHLKRVRKHDGKTTLLLTSAALSPEAPALPSDIPLSEPYTLDVPKGPALTQEAMKAKATFWPTIYAPRKKGELEPLTRGQVRWAWDAVRTVISEARTAKKRGELPIVAHVPVPYDPEVKESTQLLSPLTGYDTRQSTSHPLRHAVLNLVRNVADYRAQPTDAAREPTTAAPAPSSASSADAEASRNGAHYLLTSLTAFLSHEPCIMCSMALLHSRVKEVFYLRAMDQTGGCGGCACVPKLEGVNHRFAVARWTQGVDALAGDALDVDEATDA
ncbi:SET domain-containing cytidine deaminase-like protein [Phanerochaete sordida]|uniref:SET domain-containing cytidine deaminase-like protein n=1 Tax=Phanerochaete sordida TaxID=48140 RepID=A0A9P3G4W4_9APHY|nr:SET domain-containing cytidine deaminase-like protein [Phanerochaete sordida]